MEGQHRAFQLLEGASLQRPYPLTLQAWGCPRPSTKGKVKAFHQGALENLSVFEKEQKTMMIIKWSGSSFSSLIVPPSSSIMFEGISSLW